jgi:hypothetical protein
MVLTLCRLAESHLGATPPLITLFTTCYCPLWLSPLGKLRLYTLYIRVIRPYISSLYPLRAHLPTLRSLRKWQPIQPLAITASEAEIASANNL